MECTPDLLRRQMPSSGSWGPILQLSRLSRTCTKRSGSSSGEGEKEVQTKALWLVAAISIRPRLRARLPRLSLVQAARIEAHQLRGNRDFGSRTAGKPSCQKDFRAGTASAHFLAERNGFWFRPCSRPGHAPDRYRRRNTTSRSPAMPPPTGGPIAERGPTNMPRRRLFFSERWKRGALVSWLN